ncbi:ketopantoate reductase PanE/ApbA C terminal-domain-containing protein [Pavlovales sp. CCMP2436]|nr:ketopantoate reductase PanE/ApbA C terminal-domain-containing protein [Pavlovales sp. CCMP2436]|mmetsp:Transcript_14816/g.37438  ORF Transcript_14816/g.37438 Transcript_14816/m.37438 type:complete len:375 (-) Transcript_14816:316-1440(-)
MGPQYLVVGGGLVGSFIASTLAKNGAKVVLKVRSPPRKELTLFALRAGVEVITTLEPLVDRLRAGTSPQLDAIFVATKTYSLGEAAAEIGAARDALRPRLATVGCYNGYVLGVEQLFCEQVGGVFCKSLVPGGYTFRPDGLGFDVTNADQRWSLQSHQPSVTELAGAMTQLGVATVTGGFEADTRKYLVNTTANLVSVIANTNCHGLVTDPSLLLRMRHILREAIYVLLASPEHSPHLPQGVPLEELEEQILSGIASYGAHYPSSCQDFRAGRQIEVDSLNGYIVAIGEQLGVPTPFNAAVVDDIGIVLRQADDLLAAERLSEPPLPLPPSELDLLASLRSSRRPLDGLPVPGLPVPSLPGLQPSKRVAISTAH